MSIVDFHNHVIPAVDDGASNEEECAEALHAFLAQDTRQIIATPHVSGSLTLRPASMQARLAEIDAGWERLRAVAQEHAPEMTVHRGAEVMLDTPEPDLSDVRLRLAGTRFALCEYPYMTVPPNSAGVLQYLLTAGVTPIIAHPERYAGVDGSCALPQRWRAAGALLQVNAGSITGRFHLQRLPFARPAVDGPRAPHSAGGRRSRSDRSAHVREPGSAPPGRDAARERPAETQVEREGTIPSLAALMRVLLCALCALVVTLLPAHAQQAPVFLEPGHWTWDAARRLSAAGLTRPAADPADAPMTVRHARAVFTYAADLAERGGRRDLAALARGYRLLLDAEADSAGVLAAASVSGGWTGSRGEALGGEGYFPGQDFTGAQPLASTNGPAATLSAHGHLLPWLSWSVHGGRLAEQWVVPAATLGFAFGPIDAWAGRRRLHYGAGRGGAIVLGSGMNDLPSFAHRTLDTFEGIGIHVREPFAFPWILRALGPARIEIVAGRISRNGLIDSPWVVFGRLTGSPFGDRFMLGVNRGAIFGGEGNAVTLERLFGLIAGLHNAGFENQVISAVMRYRPPLGALPLEVFLEFGADDTAGGVTDVPTYIAGVDVAALPGLPAVSIGFEHARYSGSCCGNPPWYRNVFFRGSWSDEGRLFAHPLGGHGYEWAAHSRIDLPQHGVLLRAEAFTRMRGHENLFAPERRGSSAGGVLSLELRRKRSAVRIEGGIERADTWDQHRFSAMLSHTLR
jgi:protein-tyrosine phosphatase